eukprot:TRINITY_DN7679_c0_g1_i1.p1 TRINITY_DN7679_c0_g1~~TRINITY_DN7679_c0_g1_i1.p1  ORF type:complete len:210 (+),score=27.97 TRINITY_DN7679_c0_g1_i1:229-858(+)
MARSIDISVTNNLDCIIKLTETCPRLAQKYITHPLCYQNKKIDLRYIVLVKSILPLEVFIYKHFWIRRANKDFNLDPRNLFDYQTHFTVMNYQTEAQMVNLKYEDFISDFNQEHKAENFTWDQLQQKINKMIKQIFIAVQIKHPEMHNQNSRAIYGLDIMVDTKKMEPQLLEFSFSPDTVRACDYYNHFYNDIFGCLFLNQVNENIVKL